MDFKKYFAPIVLLAIAIQLSGQVGDSIVMAPIRVIVTDQQDSPKSGEQILFESKTTAVVYKGISQMDGTFLIDLPGGDTYIIKLKSIGEAKKYKSFTIPKLAVGEAYSESMLTIKFEVPKVITLDNVQFELGRADLTKESYTELNELLDYMRLRVEVIVEIAGHTDNTGEDGINMRLSQARADAVKDFLVVKGIVPDRVVAKGYGEDLPIDTNDTPEGRQKNRRTEVRILKE